MNHFLFLTNIGSHMNFTAKRNICMKLGVLFILCLSGSMILTPTTMAQAAGSEAGASSVNFEQQIDVAMNIPDIRERDVALFQIIRRQIEANQIDAGFTTSERIVTPVAKVSALRELSNALYAAGRTERTIETLREAIELCGRIDNNQNKTLSYLDLAVLSQRYGDTVLSRNAFTRAIRLVRRTGTMKERTDFLKQIIQVQASVGDFAGALSSAELASVYIGDKLAERMISNILANEIAKLVQNQGEVGYDEALKKIEPIKEWRPRLTGLGVLGSIQYLQDQKEKSRVTFALAQETAAAIQILEDRSAAFSLMGFYYSRTDENEKMIAAFDESFNAAIAMDSSRRTNSLIRNAILLLVQDASIDKAAEVGNRIVDPYYRAIASLAVAEAMVRVEPESVNDQLARIFELRLEIRDSDRYDEVVNTVATVYASFGLNAGRIGDLAESRTGFEKALEATAEIISTKSRDDLYSLIALNQAKIGDASAATRSADNISDTVMKANVQQRIKELQRAVPAP